MPEYDEGTAYEEIGTAEVSMSDVMDDAPADDPDDNYLEDVVTEDPFGFDFDFDGATTLQRAWWAEIVTGLLGKGGADLGAGWAGFWARSSWKWPLGSVRIEKKSQWLARLPPVASGAMYRALLEPFRSACCADSDCPVFSNPRVGCFSSLPQHLLCAFYQVSRRYNAPPQLQLRLDGRHQAAVGASRRAVHRPADALRRGVEEVARDRLERSGVVAEEARDVPLPAKRRAGDVA